MYIAERLVKIREENGYTRKRLADELNRPYATITKYEIGEREPGHSYIVEIAQKFGVTTDYILGVSDDPHQHAKKSPAISAEAQKLARDFELLDDHGRRVLRQLADEELSRMRADQVVEEPAKKVIPLFGASFAAGAPEPDFGNVWEQYEISAGDPADFAIRIHGDSMEPWLPDGSIALGKRSAPKDGEVGAFLLDGEFLCKQFCQDAPGNIYLFSLNRSRKDADVTIAHDSGRDLRYFGTIIMDRVPLPVD